METKTVDIVKWLGKMKIENYTIRDNGVVDVNGDVDLEGRLGKIERLPVQFGHVSGSFSCRGNKLTSLRGVPSVVDSNFDCSGNRLMALDGSPNSIGGSFHCNSNKLTSLENGPTNVGGGYSCGWNKLTSLDNAPRVVKGEFNCAGNYLTNLKGGPDSATDYDCYHCHLKSLEGAPREVSGAFLCYWNALTSLVGGPEKVGGEFVCWSNKLKNLIGAPEHVGGEFNCDRVGKAPKLASLEGAPKVCGKFSYAGLATINDFQGKDIPEYMQNYLPKSWWETHIQIRNAKTNAANMAVTVIPNDDLLDISKRIEGLSQSRRKWCLYVEERQADQTKSKLCYFSSDIVELWDIFQKTLETYRGGLTLVRKEYVEYLRTTAEEYESSHPSKGSITITAMAIIKSKTILDGMQYLSFWIANGVKKERWNTNCSPLCSLTFTGKKILETTGIPEMPGVIEKELRSVELRARPPKAIDDIHKWLDDFNIRGYSISDDGLINVNGNVDLSEELGDAESLPVRFGTVSGFFNCNNNYLTTLIGCPTTVSDFECEGNQLNSLDGAPRNVNGSFNCQHNVIISLAGGPLNVKGSFNCQHNHLTNLKGAPERVGGEFHCERNSLGSLVGGPKEVGGDYWCFLNLLPSLVGAPERIEGNFYCQCNMLTSLNGAPKWIGGKFDCSTTRLTTLEGAPEHVDSFILDNLDDFLGADIPDQIKNFVSKEWWDTHLVAIESKKTLNQPIAEAYEIELFD